MGETMNLRKIDVSLTLNDLLCEVVITRTHSKRLFGSAMNCFSFHSFIGLHFLSFPSRPGRFSDILDNQVSQANLEKFVSLTARYRYNFLFVALVPFGSKFIPHRAGGVRMLQDVYFQIKAYQNQHLQFSLGTEFLRSLFIL